MLTLLEKTRTLNKLLQKNKEVTVDFSEIAQVLSEMIDCNVYIISRTGKMLGDAFIAGFNCATVDNILNDNGLMPEEYNEMLLRTSQTSANILGDKNQCVFDGRHCDLGGKISTIVPITGGGERQGTLLLAKFENEFYDEDLILAEYGATIVGMEIIRSKSDKIEEEARKKAAVQIAIGTLSYSELEAIEHIFAELNGPEGLLVASKIADRVGITRSVIVNALRKFESAGVIESKSLGMKGTYIRVLNDYLLDELKKVR